MPAAKQAWVSDGFVVREVQDREAYGGRREVILSGTFHISPNVWDPKSEPKHPETGLPPLDASRERNAMHSSAAKVSISGVGFL